MLIIQNFKLNYSSKLNYFCGVSSKSTQRFSKLPQRFFILNIRTEILNHDTDNIVAVRFTSNWRIHKFTMATTVGDLSQFDISSAEKEKLVRDVIRYVLFKNEQSGGCPIKREELTQLVAATRYKQRNLAACVINEAISKLSNTFGYEMRELQRLRSASGPAGRASQQISGDAKSYIIVSQLPAEIYQKYVEDKDKAHMTGFTFVVIAVVQLAGGRITEDNLWHQLRRVGVLDSDENHPLFGNSKVALETLVQQRYLQKDKVKGPEGTTLYFELAERSLDAAMSEKIKHYISQIVQKDYTTHAVDE